MGLCKKKRNKRCIPKEGMPPASACQKKEKKIKEAYPKKVCHMLRHVKKKREKMHIQRRYATCLGMSKKRAIAPDPKRKERKERDGAYKGVHTPSTKKKYPHTCTSWSRFMTCYSFGSGLWLSKIWEASMPSNPSYLQLHQKQPLEIRWGRKAQ